jgi:hypothetical protein
MTSDSATATASGQRAHDHSARYETLRSCAMQRHALGNRDGLVVLLRQGVAAWMEAWSRLPTPPPRLAQAEPRRRSTLREDVSAEVVRVLAAMTLSHIEEVHT